MPIIDTRTLPPVEPKPGWHGRFFDLGAMSFAYYEIDAQASLHEHSHPNEEVWNVITGELEFTIGGDTFRVGAGAVAGVPPHTAHSVRALAASSVIVVDHPRRGQVGGGHRAALAVELGPGAGLETAIPFTIQNRGRTTGFIVQIDIERSVGPSLPRPASTAIPEGILSRRLAIDGGASHAANIDAPPLTAEERASVREGRAVLYARGAVFYEDVDGERHHTTFCRIFDAARGFIAPASPGYNYGD
ncbi:MAG TPA: cupin domain-containing protein [Polyangiaceae bacterium]|nr:cupin domain-containing protein [Polyangiaceae bacterium]